MAVVRPAEERDLAGIARVARANNQDDCGTDPDYVRHLMKNGLFLVAEIGEEVVAYGATTNLNGVTMLCDLFVDPARHGGGIGRRLLDVVFDGTTERVTFSSQDPRALPLYARYGMQPRWPLLYLSRPEGRTAQAQCLGRRVDADEAAKAELAFSGVDRAPDFAFWAGRAGGMAIVMEAEGEVVGAGAGNPGWLSHLRVAPGADSEVITLAALDQFPFAGAALPGPHPALRPLLEKGWRVDDFDHHMSTRDGLLDSHSILSPSFA